MLVFILIGMSLMVDDVKSKLLSELAELQALITQIVAESKELKREIVEMLQETQQLRGNI